VRNERGQIPSRNLNFSFAHDINNFVINAIKTMFRSALISLGSIVHRSRSAFLLLSLLLTLTSPLPAEDGPPISITSPDSSTTFAYATLKQHVLIWNPKAKMLIARVTFSDEEHSIGQPTIDTLEFRLPGVGFDEPKGIFYAVSAKGETIPVAHFKKALFFKTIATFPNAVVRVQRLRGNVTVVLEALSPHDPLLTAPPPGGNPDDTHRVPLDSILQ
jgi:hypothetical protein